MLEEEESVQFMELEIGPEWMYVTLAKPIR